MRQKPDLKDFKHIAIIQTAFLGDVALSLYLVQLIRNEHNDAKISFVTTPSASPLVMCLPAVDNVITYDKRGLQSGLRGIKFTSEELRERKVDCIISLHRSLRSTLVSYYSKPAFSVSFDKSAFSILYKKRIKYETHFHEIERGFSLLEAFNGFSKNVIPMKAGIPELEIEIDAEVREFVDYNLNEVGIKEDAQIILIAPCSIWETKKWHEENYSTLCTLLKSHNYKTILIGSNDDKEMCSRIAINSQSFNLAGQTSIPQTLYLMKLAKLTITNDSDPTHFAGIMKCPTVTIFGPTSPTFGFAPHGKNDRVIEVEGLKCKPCTIHGSHKCPVNTHECMTSIKPELVLNICLKVLRDSDKSFAQK
jgi:heptosyltransferase-2